MKLSGKGDYRASISIGIMGHVQTVSLPTGETEPSGDVYAARATTLVAGVPPNDDVLSKIIKNDKKEAVCPDPDFNIPLEDDVPRITDEELLKLKFIPDKTENLDADFFEQLNIVRKSA